MLRTVRDPNPDPLERGEPRRISYEEHGIGERIKSSKKRCIWKFALGDSGRCHELVLTHSLATAKKLIELDGRGVHYSDQLTPGRWSYMLNLIDSNHVLDVVINDIKDKGNPRYDLIIDRIPFRRLDLWRPRRKGSLNMPLPTQSSSSGHGYREGRRYSAPEDDYGPRSVGGAWGPEGYRDSPSLRDRDRDSPSESYSRSSSRRKSQSRETTSRRHRRSSSGSSSTRRERSEDEDEHESESDEEPVQKEKRDKPKKQEEKPPEIDLLGGDDEEYQTTASSLTFDPLVQKRHSGQGAENSDLSQLLEDSANARGSQNINTGMASMSISGQPAMQQQAQMQPSVHYQQQYHQRDPFTAQQMPMQQQPMPYGGQGIQGQPQTQGVRAPSQQADPWGGLVNLQGLSNSSMTNRSSSQYQGMDDPFYISKSHGLGMGTATPSSMYPQGTQSQRGSLSAGGMGQPMSMTSMYPTQQNQQYPMARTDPFRTT